MLFICIQMKVNHPMELAEGYSKPWTNANGKLTSLSINYRLRRISNQAEETLPSLLTTQRAWHFYSQVMSGTPGSHPWVLCEGSVCLGSICRTCNSDSAASLWREDPQGFHRAAVWLKFITTITKSLHVESDHISSVVSAIDCTTKKEKESPIKVWLFIN